MLVNRFNSMSEASRSIARQQNLQAAAMSVTRYYNTAAAACDCPC